MKKTGNNKPCYDFAPILDLATLSQVLGFDEGRLSVLANRANNLYRLAKRELKSDGTYRETFDAREPLKAIQGRIKTRLLGKVNFPTYLQGGIRDTASPRSIYTDAAMHVNAKIVIKLDVTNFYPSVSGEIVYRVWRKFFRFSHDVAQCLTKLTTKNGALVQGARTSTHIANLILWQNEPSIYERFSRKGLYYSRYIDDITISSRTHLSSSTTGQTIASVRNMLADYQLVVKRRKQTITTSGNPLLVHNLVVNKKVNFTQEKRSTIRNEVYRCEQAAIKDRTSDEYRKIYRSVTSKVGQLKRSNLNEAKKLRERLLKIKPPKPLTKLLT